MVMSDDYYVQQFRGAEKLLTQTRDLLYNVNREENELLDFLRQKEGQENVYYVCRDLQETIIKLIQENKNFQLFRLIEMFADWCTLFATAVGSNYERNDLSSKVVRNHLIETYKLVDALRENIQKHIENRTS